MNEFASISAVARRNGVTPKARASYLVSARATALGTMPMAWFCSATWAVFTPPLTQTRHESVATIHLAAESHFDRSIDGSGVLIEANVMGFFNMLDSARILWEREGRPGVFRLNYIARMGC